MRSSLFQWHPDALAFAGDKPIHREETTEPSTLIPTEPVTTAFERLASTLGRDTPFCVTDQTIHNMTSLSGNQFATMTGGTSGIPKIIARSQASWIHSFHSNASKFGYAAQDSIAVLGGLGHSLTLYGVLEGLHLGLNVHVLGPLRPKEQVRQLGRQRCSILYATPTQLRLLPASPPLTHIRLILCGGGSLTPDTSQHLQELFPNANISVFYGAAETSFVTLGDVQTPIGSVGRAYSGVDIAIRDADAAGIGTVWVNSPLVFDRYLQGDSKHTQRDGKWITVGEQGHINEDGYLFLRGRAGRTVNVADETVHLDLLESQISQIPNFPQCVLVARPDPLRGHKVIAVMDGPDTPEFRERLVSHCRHQRLHVPREVVFLDPLPTLPSGKPDFHRIATLTGSVT